MNDTATATLHDLIPILKDGEEGFLAAAEDAEAPELKQQFEDFARQRSLFAGELQDLARSLGVSNPPDGGTVTGAIHRGWLGLKAAIATRDAYAILVECERGEDAAVSAFRKALQNGPLPADVRSALHLQAAAIETAHLRIRSLRDSLAPK